MSLRVCLFFCMQSILNSSFFRLFIIFYVLNVQYCKIDCNMGGQHLMGGYPSGHLSMSFTVLLYGYILCRSFGN